MIDVTARQYIGLCMAAGGVKTGVDTVLGEVRSQRAKLVLIASDASERTKKQINDKCAFYNVRSIEVNYTSDALASLLGKRAQCAAVALTGRGPWKLVPAAETDEHTADGDKAVTEDRKDDNRWQ